MRRTAIPAFIADLFADPTARSGLLAGSAALVAAALDPKIWGPSLPNVQAAIRERPELEGIVRESLAIVEPTQDGLSVVPELLLELRS